MQQINAIREKAAEAEAIVKSITQDVQRLDIAKRNLTRTMQTLERWSMLSESSNKVRADDRTSPQAAQGADPNQTVQGHGVIPLSCGAALRTPPTLDYNRGGG